MTKPTRRAILGAIAIAPVAIAAPAAIFTASGKWTDLRDKEIAAKRAWQVYCTNVFDPTSRACADVNDPTYDAIQNRFDDLSLEHYEAAVAMVSEPAPDRAALLHKLDVIEREDLHECNDVGDFFGVISADVRRFISREA